MAASAGVGFPDGAGNLDVSWIHGSEAAKYNTDPGIQVHAYDEHTYILRQNFPVTVTHLLVMSCQICYRTVT